MFRRSGLLVLSVFAILTPFALAESPSSDLICHTSELSECYPKIFPPSSEFQIVRDDQDLPAGLHIRLNIQTGLKEAKLYDGNDDDLSSTVEVFPDDNDNSNNDAIPDTNPDTSIIPIDSDPTLNPPPADYSPPASNAQIPIPPELIQHVLHGGDRSIKRPLGDADATAFTTALGRLSSPSAGAKPPAELLYALATLEDLAHDIYWGLTLAQSQAGVVALAGLLRSADLEVGSAAALVLGNTVRNNPKALGEVLGWVPALPGEVQGLLFGAEGGETEGEAEAGLSARRYTRLMFLLSSLLAGPEESVNVVGNRDGMRGMLVERRVQTMVEQYRVDGVGSGDGWDRPRQAIADFVLDRMASVDAIKRLTTVEWRIWGVRDGYTGGKGDSMSYTLSSDSEVEAKGGEEAGWHQVLAGSKGVEPIWIKSVTDEERTSGKLPNRVAEPVRYRPYVVDALVDSCKTFEAAVNKWEDVRGSSEISTAEEHTQETWREVKERLKEIGCDCGGCDHDKAHEAKEKTEL